MNFAAYVSSSCSPVTLRYEEDKRGKRGDQVSTTLYGETILICHPNFQQHATHYFEHLVRFVILQVHSQHTRRREACSLAPAQENGQSFGRHIGLFTEFYGKTVRR